MWTTFFYGFMAGLATTAHCLGMCGGFPLHLAKSSHKGNVILRQVLFVVGKTFTYVFLGTLAAAIGAVVFRDTALANAAPLLRFSAGLLTVLFGLLMIGFRLPSIKFLQGMVDTGLVRSLYGGFLSAPGLSSAFILGLGVGFLPCPLPATMLGIAAISHHIPSAMALMAGVGMGTAPGLLAVGLFGVGIDRSYAKVGMKLAGVVVLGIGILTIGRATGAISSVHPVNKVIPSCCQGQTK